MRNTFHCLLNKQHIILFRCIGVVVAEVKPNIKVIISGPSQRTNNAKNLLAREIVHPVPSTGSKQPVSCVVWNGVPIHAGSKTWFQSMLLNVFRASA